MRAAMALLDEAAPDPFFLRPRAELLMKALHEPIHHCAEVGVLRGLWRASVKER